MSALNWLDWAVLLGTMLGIAFYGMWRTRSHRDLKTYLRGEGNTHWLVIGLSVMATQASAITFLSTPGQGYQSGLKFVQNYFGAPFALMLIAAVFIPIYQRCNVFTAYEYLGQRFDSKTRLLGAALFLFHRGIGAGITIYAPAIVLSTMLNWRLDLTILGTGILVIAYTVAGGSAAVNLTQKYQIGVIFVGMIAAFYVLMSKLPTDLTATDALTVAGGFGRINAVDFRFDVNERYTFWSGTVGGMFLALSYFGVDQSQVQRYLSGGSVRESRLGLMFNAIFKIPMQFFILLLGTMLFVFYQFEEPPVFFNRVEWQKVAALAEADAPGAENPFRQFEAQFAESHAERKAAILNWMSARRSSDAAAEESARALAVAANKRTEAIRDEAQKEYQKAITSHRLSSQSKDTDYIFVTFILGHLPHGLLGLLIAVFFAAALSSKSGELNALASTTMVDFYRHLIRTKADDSHYVFASRCFTVFWGLVAIGFALFVTMTENLIEAGNIVGSLFYGVILGLFLTGFFLPWIRGNAMFFGAVFAEIMVLVMYLILELEIGYLWYNPIGCAACILFAAILQPIFGTPAEARPQQDPPA